MVLTLTYCNYRAFQVWITFSETAKRQGGCFSHSADHLLNAFHQFVTWTSRHQDKKDWVDEWILELSVLLPAPGKKTNMMYFHKKKEDLFMFTFEWNNHNSGISAYSRMMWQNCVLSINYRCLFWGILQQNHCFLYMYLCKIRKSRVTGCYNSIFL